MSWSRIGFAAFFIFIYIAEEIGLAAEPKRVSVHTKAGEILGIVTSSPAINITSFQGIPFAHPPVGENRFAAPTPRTSWTLEDRWDATYSRPKCPEWKDYRMSRKNVTAQTNVNEDCLYLNIFVPTDLLHVKHINVLNFPVLVVMDTGELYNNSGVAAAQQIASRKNVIVATVQFRQGVLGFLSLLTESVPGNQGLLDQSLAMHWIWDNIRELGGNPERITVLGDDGEGSFVGLHAVSPKSSGIYVGLISQGGSLVSPSTLQRQPVVTAKKLALELQCLKQNIPTMADCLKQVPLETLLKVAARMETDRWRVWLPVIDGDFLTDHPKKLILQKKVNPGVYILGIPTQRTMGSTTKQTVYSPPGAFSVVDMHVAIEHYIGNYFGRLGGEISTAAIMEYGSCSSTDEMRRKTFGEFVEDLEQYAPVELTARLLSALYRTVYVYLVPAGIESRFDGTLVGLDLLPANHSRGQYRLSTPQQQLHDILVNMWTNFAKTGNPNPVSEEGVYWKSFMEQERFYFNLTNLSDGMSLRRDLKPRRMTFWNDYIPAIIDHPACNNIDDVCGVQVSAAVQQNEKTVKVMWALVVVCLALVLLVALLIVKICMPREKLAVCRQPKNRPRDSVETKRLRPLPYYDET